MITPEKVRDIQDAFRNADKLLAESGFDLRELALEVIAAETEVAKEVFPKDFDFDSFHIPGYVGKTVRPAVHITVHDGMVVAEVYDDFFGEGIKKDSVLLGTIVISPELTAPAGLRMRKEIVRKQFQQLVDTDARLCAENKERWEKWRDDAVERVKQAQDDLNDILEQGKQFLK